MVGTKALVEEIDVLSLDRANGPGGFGLQTAADPPGTSLETTSRNFPLFS